MKPSQPLALVGYACGIGAGNSLCEHGPLHMKNSPLINNLNIYWEAVLSPKDDKRKLEALESIVDISTRLADTTCKLAKNHQFFITIGGDHSSAVGTWSGVASAISPQKLGLIWIDAHLDSHTVETTPSGNIHGMPLASLLGHGDKQLTSILTSTPKLLPENVCLIGIRSFEPEEKNLLEKLGVRIFYIDEVKEKGFEVVLNEAVAIVTHNADYFGISLDLDAINPHEAPGVGTPEPEGISSQAVIEALAKARKNPKLIGAEIVEFNPSLDKNHKTEKIIAEILGKFSK